MSFVTFARSRALLRAGTKIAARMPMAAITTSNSMRVKAWATGGGELLAMGLWFGTHHIALGRGAKAKKIRKKQDCLTRHWSFCVCRSCQTKSLLHRHLRQRRDPSRVRNPYRLDCLRT